MEKTTILARKPYNDELGKGFESNKEDHYLQNFSLCDPQTNKFVDDLITNYSRGNNNILAKEHIHFRNYGLNYQGHG